MIFRVVSLGGIFSISILVGWRSLRIGVLVSLVSSSLIFSGLSSSILSIVFSIIIFGGWISSCLIIFSRFRSCRGRVSKNRSGI